MSPDENDRRDDWRYLLLLYQDGIPVWLETSRLPGLPEGTARIKIGKQYYFLSAKTLFHDMETAKMLCFLEIENSIHLDEDTSMSPDGKLHEREQDVEVDPPDVMDFIQDSRFKQIETPF